MTQAIIWWLTVEILALASLPVACYLFRRLPDKGYGLAKAVGILLPAYVFWLLSMLGALDNVRRSIALVVVALGLLSWVALAEGRRQVLMLWRERRGLILLIEVLFAVAFAAWCVVRAYNPEIAGTEKPMDVTFLNGIMRSQQFPPVDPWLSGYSISYYYFGYLMVGMLAKLAGISASVAFNLGVALLFALTVIGAFSLAYNLAAGRGEVGSHPSPHPSPLPEGEGTGNRGLVFLPVIAGLLGALFSAVMGNLEGLLEMFHSHAALPISFWQWLNIENLDKPYMSAKWYPTDWYWWFRASRVIRDYNPITKISHDYTINEFPNFSFILGDLHPHVLALPFAFVGMALALAMLKSEDPPPLLPKGGGWSASLRLPGHVLDYLLWGIVFGGLGFLNTWDMPTYLAIFILAFVIKRRLEGRSWLRESAQFGAAMLAVSFTLYLPFYLGFSSQVKGLGIVFYRTNPWQFLIFWGPLIFFAAALLAAKWGEVLVVSENVARRLAPSLAVDEPSAAPELARRGHEMGMSPRATAEAISGGTAEEMKLAGDGGSRSASPSGRGRRSEAEPAEGGPSAADADNYTDDKGHRVLTVANPLLLAAGAILLVAVAGRFLNAGVVVAMLLMAIVAYGLLFGRLRMEAREDTFTVLLVLAGVALVAGTELFFIRDIFGNRMNTVFKVYYQVWQMLAMAGAYVVYCVLRRRGFGPLRWPFKAASLAAFCIAVLLVLAALVYPVAATITKTGEFAGKPNLDGLAFLAASQQGDYDAIVWLNKTVAGTPTILEAAGGSYSQFGRISAFTGLPTVVGWDGHELQWRGNGDEAERRKADVETIYQTADVNLARSLLKKYGVSYVYVGALERETYGKAGELGKFASLGKVVYDRGDVVIYKTGLD